MDRVEYTSRGYFLAAAKGSLYERVRVAKVLSQKDS